MEIYRRQRLVSTVQSIGTVPGYVARGDIIPDWWWMFRETAVDRYDDEVELAIRIELGD